MQDGKGKDTVPVMRLNVVRLLAELCVCLKRWEVVDMILPLFIEHLEEGDASSPSLLRLKVWNFVSYPLTYLPCVTFDDIVSSLSKSIYGNQLI